MSSTLKKISTEMPSRRVRRNPPDLEIRVTRGTRPVETAHVTGLVTEAALADLGRSPVPGNCWPGRAAGRAEDHDPPDHVVASCPFRGQAEVHDVRDHPDVA